MLYTLQHEVKFDKDWTFEPNDQYSVWTCYSGMDLCWIVDAKYSGTAWTYTASKYQAGGLRFYEFTPGAPAPTGNKSRLDWSAQWDEAGKVSTLTAYSDQKTYDELIYEASDDEHQVFVSKYQYFMRYWGAYEWFLNGWNMDTQTFIWLKDSK